MVLLARLLMVVAIAIVLFDPQAALAQQKQPTAVGSGGAAASVDLAGTQAAIRTLRQGGNAVDAAVAAAGVLGVTEPFSCGVGGGGFMVIRTSKGKITTIDGREESPRSMRPDSFWENGAPLAFDAGRYSGMSAGIPGTPATWQRALDRYGTWSLARALRPGIRVASDGFTVDQTFFDQTTPNIDWFNDIPSTAAIYLDPDGTPRDVGTTLQNPDLARTYRLLGREGVDAFYRGELASAMAEASQHPPKAADANHAWRPGLMTTDDLRRYRAIERAATRSSYRGLDIWGMGPPSSGGSTVGEALNILEGYQGLAARPRAGAPPPARVVALHVRRPQRLPGGPGLLRGAARRPPLRQLRRRAARADQGARPPPARWRPATRTTTRRRTASPAAAARRSATRASPPPTSSSRTARATSCPTRSRSSRRAATRSSCPATASS